ncbi:copper homeostasis protein CutC [Tsukamurella paurometabola]|uniref:copper homeostasis protein CutC n=1 Tax=Tsukamurella paurometabola TaxID=2061 RepID=UPI000314683B|nr:copper homeostasis protein CutC [Tsukamurella paurometabola]
MTGLLEVIALTAADAVAAQEGGADQVELVADMAADGLTPEAPTVTAVLGAVDIPVRVMLRLSAGFAVGDVDELLRRANMLHDAGADEFVLGFLAPDGSPDLATIERIVHELHGAPWTFHRAIDHCSNRDDLRASISGLTGLDAILTAGAADGVDAGIDVLLTEEPGPQRILVGGGLRIDHLPRLRAAGIDGFHVGSGARPNGWCSPVSAPAVRLWRNAIDD